MNNETQLGTYEIKAFLTEIGLDDLYLARDTRIDAPVVIRLLPVFFDEEATITRLRQDAHRMNAMEHPSLLPLTEVEHVDGTLLAIAPLPDGKALDMHIPDEGLVPRQVLELSLALVSALDKLHCGDQLHGYLHAGRVVVSEDHNLKLLVIGPDEAERTPPLRAAACRSPESWTGGGRDACSEVFSIGVLLHLIATSHMPFAGDTIEEIARAIQEDVAPTVTEIRPELPKELAGIIARCLKKNRDHRYPSAKELRTDLEALRDGIASGKVAVGRQRPATSQAVAATPPSAVAEWFRGARNLDFEDRRVLGGAAATLLLMTFAAGYLFGAAGNGEPLQAPPRLSRATFAEGQELSPSLSADGTRMVFARAQGGGWDVYRVERAGGAPVSLTAGSGADDYQPALSSDGLRIAFRSEREGGGIFLMSHDGSGPRRLADFGFNPAWSPDGLEIAVADVPVYDSPYPKWPESKIWAINANTGDRRAVTQDDGHQPAWSPGGTRIAYWGWRADFGADIWTTPAGGGNPVAVTDGPSTDWNPVWSPDGAYVYFTSDRSGTVNIWRVAIDESSGEAQGRPQPVTTGGSVESLHPTFARDTGTLVYVEASSQRAIHRIPFDASSGRVTGPPELVRGPPRGASAPNLAPDGERLAFVLDDGSREDIYVSNIDGTELARITYDGAHNQSPRFSPDGRNVAFLSDREATHQLWTADTNGSSEQQLTELKAGRVSQPVWSRDGSGIAITVGSIMTPSYTLLFDADEPPSEQVAETLHSTPSEQTFEPHSWSRDGTRMAGNIRDRNGRLNGIGILTVGSKEYAEIVDFGTHPIWLRDGRRLLFQNGSDLYLLDTRSPEPSRVFTARPDVLGEVFAVSSDNRWIYVSLERKEADLWLLDR